MQRVWQRYNYNQLAGGSGPRATVLGEASAAFCMATVISQSAHPARAASAHPLAAQLGWVRFGQPGGRMPRNRGVGVHF